MNKIVGINKRNEQWSSVEEDTSFSYKLKFSNPYNLLAWCKPFKCQS